MRRYLLKVCAAMAFAASTTAAHSAQFVFAAVNTSTFGYVSDPNSSQSRSSFDFSTTVKNLAAETQQSIFEAPDRLDMNIAASVNFLSPNRFRFSDSSSVFFSDLGSQGSRGYGQVGSSFFYNFIVSGSERLQINYSFAKSIDPLPPFVIGGDPARVSLSRRGDPQGSVNILTIRPNSSGNFDALLGPGEYFLQVSTILNGSAFRPPETLTEGARFDFNLRAAVPEPATWSMMILGFGFVGHALRSRKRRSASAFAG